MKQFRHNFTLLEILVAVAVLVIMMGFLFQFVISAQRVWAASTARNYMTDQANVVFQMMAEDFSQMVTVTEDENPDSVMGWLCEPAPNDANPDPLDRLFFFVGDRDDADGAYYGVMYFYNHDSTSDDFGKLYRVRTKDPAWEKVGKTSTPDGYDDFDLPYETVEDCAAEYGGTADDYVVAENITEFTVQASGPTGRTTLPKFFRITMKVTIPEDLANVAKGDQTLDRTFSRVFFQNTGK